ncbi:MAG TPA: lytic transglycosylase domain-containing protein [Jatrophihabitans sp.]|nr:lytic transglycosylase domain-containing protein [Jatrophihabitans sp.]
MAHPRYASAGARLNFSLTQGLLGLIVLSLTALVLLPLAHPSGSRLDAATAAQPVAASAPASSSAPAPASSAAGWSLIAGDIRPSKIGSAPPADPITDVVYGPAGPMSPLGIPVMVLRAYHLAADRLATEQPSCKLPWWLLAGIGHTESGHAEGGRLTADGTTRGLILGPRLNGGIKGDAIISDTDHGLLDGDTVYDRAVGPMQFIPSTWAHWAADGNGDGKKNPSNIYDATLAAARYLCADGRDLSTLPGLDAAVLSYNHSQPYLETVLAWGMAYRDGASSIQDSTLPVVVDVTKVRPPVSSRPPTHKINLSTPVSSAAAAQPSASGGASGSSPSSSSSDVASSSPTPSCSSSPTDSTSTSASSEQASSGQASSGQASSGQASSARASGQAATAGSSSPASASAAGSTNGSAAGSAAGSTAGSATADGSAAPSDSPSDCASK